MQVNTFPSGSRSPDVSVAFDPELIALLRPKAAAGAAGMAAPSPAAVRMGGAVGTEVVEANVTAWDVVRLRQDGARPHICSVLLVLEVCDQVSVSVNMLDSRPRMFDVNRVFRVYVAQDGSLLCHGICTPPDAAPARPVFRVRALKQPDDWHGFASPDLAKACFDASTCEVALDAVPPPGLPNQLPEIRPVFHAPHSHLEKETL